MAKATGNTVHTFAPQILTGLGVAGLISTVVLAVRATPAAMVEVYNEMEARDVAVENVEGAEPIPLTMFDYIKVGWKPYIPAITVGILTGACIVGAQSVNAKRQALLISAYSVSDQAFKEYRAKVVEQLGETKDQKVYDGIAADKLAQTGDESKTVVVGDGKILVFDAHTGQFFDSSIQDIKRAVNELNAEIINNGYASQNDFHSLVGLKRVKDGDDFGWSTDKLLEIMYTSMVTDDDRTALVLNYRSSPKQGFFKVF